MAIVVDVLVPILIILLFICAMFFALPNSCLPDNLVGGDSGDVGVNVTTGKVKVDITDVDGNSIVGEVLEFETGFEDKAVRFEPGVAYRTEGFKVKNTGELKISYRMYVSREEGVDMIEFDNAFEFYVTTNPDDLDSLEQIKSFDGALDSLNSSETYYLVVKMKGEAGNDFQGKTFTGIGITVNATQYSSEG